MKKGKRGKHLKNAFTERESAFIPTPALSVSGSMGMFSAPKNSGHPLIRAQRNKFLYYHDDFR